MFCFLAFKYVLFDLFNLYLINREIQLGRSSFKTIGSMKIAKNLAMLEIFSGGIISRVFITD